MRIGWLVDYTDAPGGAELTQGEFRDAAPDNVTIVDCPPGDVDEFCDRYVIQNCVRYTLADLARTEGRPVVKYWHDVGPWIKDDVRAWLDANTRAVCCSPIQAEHMGLEKATCIPPHVDLTRFEEAASRMNGDRSGAVCIGSWRNHGKAPHKAAEWAASNGSIDFFGGGAWAPHGSKEVPYDHMPTLLASYETFVFLPTVLEPFGRLVAEAWAAGCTVVTNNLVGAKWWIENDPGALDRSAENFWSVVLA
jgi:glycosyltransferase involved in cell wall biosynthesis